ncbi:MAG: type II toxin-antitoxin system prevent-host-death family antitoxin [Verrucomicrobiales bacterium]|nr:type II toxin-antitoxin system prevent-host-death family antitoxin [Verrucomicrobiales bacterium]
MMVNIHAAKTRLSELVARVEKGQRITIARAGKPVAQLVPVPKARSPRLPPDDPLLHLEQFGFDGPGGRLTARESDRLVYGT